MKKSNKKHAKNEIEKKKDSAVVHEYTVKELIELGEKTNKLCLAKDNEDDKNN